MMPSDAPGADLTASDELPGTPTLLEQPEYRLELPGDPMPMPRVKARVAGKPGQRQWVHIYTPSAGITRAGDFGRAWTAEGLPKLSGPLSAKIACGIGRPAGHFGTGRNAGQIKPRYALERPIARGAGDVDNFAKLVLDGLADDAYFDDAQIAELTVGKWYADQLGLAAPATIVTLRALA